MTGINFNSIKNYLAGQYANKNKRRVLLVASPSIAFIVLILLWFTQIYADPQNVFWGMINKSLSTPGITKLATHTGAKSINEERTQLSFNPNPILRDEKHLSDSSAGQATRLTLETIATPADFYQRYSSIDQPKGLSGKKPDYSRLYDLWLKNGGQSNNGNGLFKNSILGLILFGNLPTAQRIQLVDLLQNHGVYTVDFKKVQKSHHGKRTYTFDVVVNLQNYAKAATQYLKDLGLSDKIILNPADFPANSSRKLSVSIDVLSRQLTQINYTGTGNVEQYSGQGIIANIQIPTQIVDLTTYQKYLNSVSQ